jgi:hypothetical protein
VARCHHTLDIAPALLLLKRSQKHCILMHIYAACGAACEHVEFSQVYRTMVFHCPADESLPAVTCASSGQYTSILPPLYLRILCEHGLWPEDPRCPDKLKYLPHLHTAEDSKVPQREQTRSALPCFIEVVVVAVLKSHGYSASSNISTRIQTSHGRYSRCSCEC